MKRTCGRVSRTVLPHAHVFDFNQALMDFGATLCTARKPQCRVCPMRRGCAAVPVRTPNDETAPSTIIVVTAAVIERDGTFLVTRRLAGHAPRGLWEFPGGKCEPGESHPACLRREIREELGVDAAVDGEIFAVTHAYADRVVELHFFACELAGEPQPLIGQEMRWVARRAARWSSRRRMRS